MIYIEFINLILKGELRLENRLKSFGNGRALGIMIKEIKSRYHIDVVSFLSPESCFVLD